MKSIFILFLLTICYSSSIFGQEEYSLQFILNSDSTETSEIIRNKNKQIIYTGSFTYSNHSTPIGKHFYYDNNGNIKQLIEYSFYGDYFEGRPTVVQKCYIFDKDQKLEKIIEQLICGECDYIPYGTWKYFENGKLIKLIHTDNAPDLELEEVERKEFEIYWDLLKKVKD